MPESLQLRTIDGRRRRVSPMRLRLKKLSERRIYGIYIRSSAARAVAPAVRKGFRKRQL